MYSPVPDSRRTVWPTLQRLRSARARQHAASCTSGATQPRRPFSRQTSDATHACQRTLGGWPSSSWNKSCRACRRARPTHETLLRSTWWECETGFCHPLGTAPWHPDLPRSLPQQARPPLRMDAPAHPSRGRRPDLPFVASACARRPFRLHSGSPGRDPSVQMAVRPLASPLPGSVFGNFHGRPPIACGEYDSPRRLRSGRRE